LALALSACERVEWGDAMPKQLVGNWTQVSDDISAGRAKPSFFVVGPRGVVHRWFDEDANRYESREYPFIKVSKSGSSFIVFCGKPDSSTIADHRYQFAIEKDANFAPITEIVATGLNDNDGSFYQGRFVVK
jgi:hypothetical protein